MSECPPLLIYIVARTLVMELRLPYPGAPISTAEIKRRIRDALRKSYTPQG